MNIDSYLNHIQNRKTSVTERFSEEKKRIMIDFDGVLHDYSAGWNKGKLGNILFGCKEAIDKLHNDGFEIVIFTTRAVKTNKKPTSEELISDLKRWLEDNKIYYDRITGEKLGAIAYIDDRAIRFENNWKLILDKIKLIPV